MTDLERLERELFEAARGESPRPTLRADVLARAPRSKVPSRVYAAALGVAAIAAGALLYLARAPSTDPGSSVRAEPVTPMPRISVPSTRVEPRVEPPTPAETGRALAKRPKAESSRSLAEQLKLLKEARHTLRGGDPGTALSLLDQYASGANSVDMSAEATLLRIEALAKLGRHTEARQLAERFIANNQDNPLVDRARALVGGSTSESGMGRENDNDQRDQVEHEKTQNDTQH